MKIFEIELIGFRISVILDEIQLKRDNEQLSQLVYGQIYNILHKIKGKYIR